MNQEKNKTLKTSLPVRTAIRAGIRLPPKFFSEMPTIRSSSNDAAEQRRKPIYPFI